ncbi:MAG: phosphoenolpyruvate--protein phosphotransferase [Spirochaetales bacterium]|nr:phosphoenolpyruvate--protein phosphotransferase [Spirochaetales bacterium]
MTDSSVFSGIAASPGIGIAPAYILRSIDLNLDGGTGHEVGAQLRRFKDSQVIVREQISGLKEAGREQADEWTTKIFDSHLFLIGDPELQSRLELTLKENGVTAEYALLQVREELAALLEASGSELMVERANDIRDVTDRMIAVLTGQQFMSLGGLTGTAILVSHDLSPLDTARMNKDRVKGIITETGGYTSHTAIIARSRGIPAVTGVRGAAEQLENGSPLIIDGGEGRVVSNPSLSEIEIAGKIMEKQVDEIKRLNFFINKKTLTLDGNRIILGAQIGQPGDIEEALTNGAEGIGLYRTEFLFMQRTGFPDEETQYQVYRDVLERMNPQPVIIRTMDVGGDKKLPYANFPSEANPFLGLRGIRYSLKNPEIFRVQLRALLRASQYGNLKIMFPMVATTEEVVSARGFIKEETEKIISRGGLVSEDLEIGVMIEVPAAALIADELASFVDFFSIGTNDLIQYTMAADRMNDEVSHLYQPLNPAVLHLIKMVTEAARRHGIWTGICGEMAGDFEAIPVLLELGVTEFSLSAPRIPAVRELISLLDLSSPADSPAKDFINIKKRKSLDEMSRIED